LGRGSKLRREGGLLAGYATFAIFEWFHAPLAQQGGWMQPLLFLWLFAVMLWCVLGVVRHADALAERLGEPYGTLILTLSVIVIEVSLIAAVMLSGDSDPTLARDTMFAVLMIVLNGLVGAALLIGAIYHREQEFNFQGTGQFLSVLLPLSVFSLVLPRFTVASPDAAFDATQAIMFSVLIVLLYGVFLMIQTVRHAAHFAEPAAAGQVHREEHGQQPLLLHALLLLLFLVPVVLLSEEMAVLIDHGVETLNLPAALGGVVIAALVLSAEGLAAIRAARQNRLQRSVNICLGSALSTIGLTAPAVLTIGLVLGEPVLLGLDPVEMVLLALTLLNCIITFRGTRTNMLQGAVHLVLFVAYLALVFDP
jgi:Ca2+:H+ antiporter